MEIITKQEIVDYVPVRFEAAYRDTGYGPLVKIMAQLKALAQPLDCTEVDNIIGNNSWTQLKCDECSNDVDKAVIIGPNCEDGVSVVVCKKCLDAAQNLI